MAKQPLPERTGQCPICGINLYGDKETTVKNEKGLVLHRIKGYPNQMPCGVGLYRPEKGKDAGKCPFETEKEQQELVKIRKGEIVAGMLGTDFGGVFDDA